MSESLMLEKTLAHYRIIAPIGAGGMGEVYLAEDTRLDRKVAVKLLGDGFTNNEDRLRRFITEAKAASALNHPNIITVYDVGQSEGGAPFIATEYIEGETLRHHIQPSRLKTREVVDLIAQVASALAAAHQAGIIHRDIKPENIMIRPDGYVKVLDFGLAKLTEKQNRTTDSQAATVSHRPTDPGTVMGTVAYMSPEQARGKAVDARSDIFSLGVVLYEMVAGRPPFTGESSTDVLAAILDKEPPPLVRFADETPAELQRIVSKCLRKACDERYQTMKDVLLDLRELRDELVLEAKLDRSLRPATSMVENQPTLLAAAGATQNQGAQVTGAASAPTTSSAEYLVGQIQRHKRGAVVALVIAIAAVAGAGYWLFGIRTVDARPIESIAVMPFVNEGGNAEVEYLSDGMTETLISSLSQLPKLSVKARSSVFRYKGKDANPQTIGKELNVQAVLNGRVVQRGDRLTLTLELIDARTENVIWSESYNRRQADLVSLQSEIARDVSSKLKLKLSGADQQKLAKNYTTDPEAYRLYLQGRFYWNKREEKEFRQAIEYFNQAIALDPNYAMAYVGLADSYAMLYSFGFMPPTEAIPKARDFARRALSLDESLAEPHATLGYVTVAYDYDFAATERQYQQAIELNPNYAMAHQWYGEILTNLGRFEEAAAEYRRALEIEPLSLPTNWEYGRFFYNARRFDEAIAQLKKTIELDPGFARAHRTLSEVYWARGEYANAVEERAKFFDLIGQPQNGTLMRATFAKEGWAGFLRLIVAENSPLKDSNNHWTFAKVYVGLGEQDKALAELNKAYENHISSLLFLKVEPQLDPLRDDPRFQELLRKVGFPP